MKKLNARLKVGVRKPLVSVVMPVYNAEKFLAEAIKSILSQTYPNFELIIVNDNSTDDSVKIINKFKKRFPKKIRVYHTAKNLNCGGDMCANIGITQARGKYIARMDADDIAINTRLANQVEFLENNKKVFLVGSNAHVIDTDGKIIGEKLEPLTPSKIYNTYFTFHPLIHPTCMFRSKFKRKKFRYIIRYNANNDYLTFFTLICRGAIFVNLEEKLLYYRIHEHNDTFYHMKRKFLNTVLIRLYVMQKYGYSPSFSSLITTFAQAIIVFTLPETILKKIYFWAKGISKDTVSIPNLKLSVSK